MKFCACGRSHAFWRCSPKGSIQYLLALAGIYTYKCVRCDYRTSKVAWSETVTVASFAVAIIAVLAGFYAVERHHATLDPLAGVQNIAYNSSAGMKSDTVLQNQDIIALADHGVSPKTIVGLIERLPCRFNASPAEMIRMKERGVNDDVMRAVVSNLDHCQAETASAANIAHLAGFADARTANTAVRAQ